MFTIDDASRCHLNLSGCEDRSSAGDEMSLRGGERLRRAFDRSLRRGLRGVSGSGLGSGTTQERIRLGVAERLGE
jgi:hypothetical protein